MGRNGGWEMMHGMDKMMHGVEKMDTEGNPKEGKLEIWMEEGLVWVNEGRNIIILNWG